MKKIMGFLAVALLVGGVFVSWSGCSKETEEAAPAKKEERAHPQGQEKEGMKAGNAGEAESASGKASGTVPARSTEEAGRDAPAVVEDAATPPERSFSTRRLLYVREHGLPPDYEDLSNPLDATEERIKRGDELFATRCALCHGEKALGDGPAGRTLSPPASNLSIVVGEPDVTDGYLFWTITEGGGALGTAMPSFRTLPEEERWTIILYLRERIAEKR